MHTGECQLSVQREVLKHCHFGSGAETFSQLEMLQDVDVCIMELILKTGIAYAAV